MSEYTNKSSRIAQNTILLYGRMFIMLIVSLYTSRVILRVLGVEDYGIYNVVGGLVSMFTIFSGSLSGAISRFMTYELGKGDNNRLKTVFTTSINIQICLIIVLFLVFETLGVWFLNNRMQIPDGRLTSANWVLQFSLLTFSFNLLSIPYNAAIISHEKMSAFAYISLFEVFAKLAVAFIIIKNPFDRLIYYSLLLLIISIFIRLLYWLYCKKSFEECTYQLIIDKKLTKEMLSFAGWSFFGAGSTQLMNQGVDLLSNIYFGVIVNASRGISNQVNSAVISFVNSFTTAVNPQLIKSYAAGEYDYMKALMYKSSKFSFFLLLIFAVPLVCETDIILKLWLVEVPEHATNFVRLIICISLVFVLSNSMITVMLATGRIKKYQLIIGSLGMLVFPISWAAFALGMSPEASYIIMLCVYFVQMIVRIYLLRDMVEISVKLFFRDVIWIVFRVTIIALILPLILITLMEDSIIRLIMMCLMSSLSVFFSVYILGLTCGERQLVLGYIKRYIRLK